MLDAMLAKAQVGFAFIDATHRLRRVSHSLAEITGTKPEEQIGCPPAEVWPAALATVAESALRDVLTDLPAARNGQADAEPSRTDEVDIGQGRRLALSWYPAHDTEGGLTGVTLIAVDVSGDHAAAEAVRRTGERYRSLVQAGNQVVWITDPRGDVAEDSPEWRWITGQSLDDYLADGWVAAIHPNDKARIERDWRECIRTGTVFDASYRVRTKTGSYRHYDVRAVPIERDGAIVEWMGASTDVTGQREADEMRGRLTEQLSAAALRTSRLQQATSLLAEALSVKEVLTVITEVGRSAIGADRSAVAVFADDDRLRLRVLRSDGSDDGPGELAGEIPLRAPSVMSAAIELRRSIVFGTPEALRRQFEENADGEVALLQDDEQAWVGLPLTA